jgi:hypothetical protein
MVFLGILGALAIVWAVRKARSRGWDTKELRLVGRAIFEEIRRSPEWPP